MPKRSNPFGDSSPLQFKTYVRKKEVDMGVCKDDNMRAVYAKTKNILFEGSKKASSTSPCLSSSMEDLQAENTRSELHPLPGQLHIDSQGYLCGNPMQNVGIATSHKPDNNNPFSSNPSVLADIQEEGACGMDTDVPGPSSSNAFSVLMGSAHKGPKSHASGMSTCHSCNRPGTSGIRHCNFCDKVICASCIRQCCACQGLYCHVCSVLNYDNFSEQAFCLHCAS